MKDNYILMHKDAPCAIIAIDKVAGTITEAKIYERKYTPFLGNSDLDHLKRWWNHRAVSGARMDMQRLIKEAGCENTKSYLAKNLALSITDTYWICPVDMHLSWDEVKLFNNHDNGTLIPYNNESTYDPNASLGGEMSKYWDLSGKDPILVKRAFIDDGQQAINELFATDIHKHLSKNVPYLVYTMKSNSVTDKKNESSGLDVSCKAFTSESEEFVSAFEILNSRKHNNSVSYYDEFVDICEENGLSRSRVQEYMDYQALTDIVISNTDRHFMNFGVLRDVETMELTDVAPIFDSGNSMFLLDNKVYSKEDVLKRKISGVVNSEQKLLDHIANKEIIDLDLLPSGNDVLQFYVEHGMPKARAELIAENYVVKRNALTSLIRE